MSFRIPSIVSSQAKHAPRALDLLSKRLFTSQAHATVAVCGAGQMGGGIAQVLAASGRDVLLIDTNPVQIDKSIALTGKLLTKDVGKGRITEAEREAILGRIKPVTSIGDAGAASFAIEAASENFDIKQAIFAQLDSTLPADAILATNTSSISITKIAATTSRPDQVVGMHFMNPVPVMRLVEIIPGLQTSDSVLQQTLDLAHDLGKETVQSRDYPGFIANRILMPYINEACQALADGVASPADIDSCMKGGTNVPMGPLTLADFIGLDTCLAIMRVLHTEFGDSKYRPSPILVKHVEAGWLGKKTGRGFYQY